MGAIVVALTYFFITAVCVCLSGISTYWGFHSMLDTLTLPFTAVIVAGLFACDIAILDRRRHGQSLWGAVLILLLFTAASWVSNFHFFYSTFAGAGLAKDRYQHEATTFDRNIAAAQSALRMGQVVPQARRDIDKAFDNLKTQINSTNQSGFGPISDQHVDEIYDRLKSIGQTLTPLKRPDRGTPPARAIPWVDQLSSLAQAALKRAEDADPWAKSRLVLDDAVRQASKARAAAEVSGSASDYLAAMRKLAEQNSRVQLELTQVFAENKRDNSAINVPTLSPIRDVKGTELATITESVQSGLYERPDLLKSVAAGLAAVFVDLMPLIFALVLIRPPRRTGDASEANTPGPLIFTPKPADERRPPKLAKLKGIKGAKG